MFSLKTTTLKPSKAGILLWALVALSYVALLQLYWMPVFLRASLFLCAGFLGLLFLFYRIRKTKKNEGVKIGIDEKGAFLFQNGQYKRLLFLRANHFQLIATTLYKPKVLDRFWPTYQVVFFDSLSKTQYSILRSFAAQQILLHRSEEAKKRFK